MPNPVWQAQPHSLAAVTLAASLACLHPPAFSQQASSGAPQSFVLAEDGARLYYHVIGTGSPVVIAPAGFFFDRDLAALGRGHTVVFYDMRDRGRSEPIADSTRISIANDVADLEAVRRHIGAERFVALGWSYLGQVVMRYAAAHPDHLERIVLIGPLARRFGTRYPDSLSAHDSVPVPDPTRLAQLAEVRKQGQDVRDARADCEMDYAVNRARLIGQPEFAGRVPDLCDLPNEWIAHNRQHNRFLFTTIIQDEAPGWDRFASLRMPVLVIHGTQDRNVPYGSGREWTSHLPGARLLTIRGAAHMPWLDAPDVVIPAIDSFLNGTWPSSAARVVLEPSGAARDSMHPAPAAALSTARPANGTRVFPIRRKTQGDSIAREFGTMTVTQATFDSAGESLLRRVIVYDYGAGGCW